MEKKKIREYFLRQIFSGTWKPGNKIPSALDLSKLMGCSIATIKKEIDHFKDNGFFKTKLRVGIFVNIDFFSLLPMSLQQKYNLKNSSVKHIHNDDSHKLIKRYKTNEKLVCLVETEMIEDIFSQGYNSKKTFMNNLMDNGYFIDKIKSHQKLVKYKNRWWVLEKRHLFKNDILIAKENIYVDYRVWHDKKAIRL